MRYFLVISLLFSFACSETSQDPEPSSTELQSVKQAIVDPGGNNWITVGGDGFVELLGTDGTPDTISGRIVFEGTPISSTLSGHDKWVVFGDGKLQSLDHSGQRNHDVRAALSGNLVKTSAIYPMGWMIGGENGALQTLDTSGEPTNVESSVLGSDTIVGLAYSGVAWLAMSETGKTLIFNSDLNIADTSGTPVFTEGVGALSNGDLNVEPRWLVFSKANYASVSASGVAGTSIALPDADITSVHYSDGSVFIGANNGDVYRADYATNLNFAKVATLKSGIRRFVSNTQGQILALAQASIIALNTNDGSEFAAEQDVDGNFVSAHFSEPTSEWILVYDSNGLVRFLGADLTPKIGSARLNGVAVNGAAKGTEGVLIVGNEGMIQLVEDDGATISTPQQLDASVDLLDVEWNGESFLVVGTKGFSQIISASGVPGDKATLLDDGDIRFASWSGSFYLIGGDSHFQIIRPTGVALGAPGLIEGTLRSAAFDGQRWLAVGSSINGGGVAMFINEENNENLTPILVPAIEHLNGVDFDGLEWLVGGTDGLIQRIGASGQTIGAPVSALDGLDIHAVFFNGLQYLVGGELGAVRRVGSDFTPIRTTLSITNSQAVRDLLWAKPRGFPNGACITNDLCFAGPCVGGLAAGKCCNSACDKPCESCFQRDTGEDDGTCAPVVAGKQSPKSGDDGCAPQPESSCGQTGFCDGAGECAFYDDSVQCSPASCSNSFAAAGSCDGSGACSMPASQDCAPYLGCEVDSGCQTTCADNDDCVIGFICEGDQCVEEEDPTPTTGTETPTPEDEGCSTSASSPSSSFWLIVLGLFFFRRRSNRISAAK